MGQSPADVQKGLAEVGIGTKAAGSEYLTNLSTDEASTNFYWTVGETEIFNLQTTLRGNVDPAAVKRHLSNVKACLAGVVAVGGHAKAVGKQAEPMPVANATAPIPPAGAPVPPPPNGAAAPAGNQESVCAMVEVGLSYTGNKPQLKFHVNGMDHPLSYTKEIGDMARLLAPLGFTAAHIVVGQKYPVACIVTWQQGEKYRNVLSVRKA